jgi:hypothetical protein
VVSPLLGVTVELLLALATARHPIHASSAVITAHPGAAVAEIVLRAYADDLPPGSHPGQITRYLTDRFRITDRAGRRIPLRVEAARVVGPTVVTVLSAAIPKGLAGARIWHGVLAERFPDQVNIVRAHYGGRVASLVFTASDSAKSLP